MNQSAARTSSRRANDESSLKLYLRDIQRYPLLSREEENEIAERVRAGDPEARERLIRSNLRFVVTIAKRYVGNGVALEDLINDGNLGLVKAAERFDPARGYKFISYAVWWIRQSILNSVSETPRMVRLPMNRVGLAQRAARVARSLEQDLGREPRADEIARELSVKPAEVEEVFSMSRGHLSLDEPIGGDSEDTSYVDQIEDPTAERPDRSLYDSRLSRDLRRVLENLTDREREILTRYYGLDGEEPMTLEAIGGVLGYTRERIRQVKEQAIEKLRTRPAMRQIGDYLHA
jgi:RNA polymerase primary sigma factor